MGELDIKPFQEAAKRKISDEMNEKAVTKREFSEKVQMKAIEWCSKWDGCVKDPSWHPFKVVTDREGNSKVQRLHKLCLFVKINIFSQLFC